MRVGIRYDLRAAPGGASHEALSRAAIEQCAAVDGQGVDHVQLSEHHGSDDGYCPSPLVLGAAVAAVTRQLDLLFAAVVLPLHDPIRVAEDVAVLDQISGGRVHLGCVAGYCEPEFALFGVPFADRARRLEAGVAQLRLAWTGEPFRHRRTTVSVHPRPARAGGPPVYLGGRAQGRAPRRSPGRRHAVRHDRRDRGRHLPGRARATRAFPGPVPTAGSQLVGLRDRRSRRSLGRGRSPRAAGDPVVRGLGRRPADQRVRRRGCGRRAPGPGQLRLRHPRAVHRAPRRARPLRPAGAAPAGRRARPGHRLALGRAVHHQGRARHPSRCRAPP